MRPPRSSKDHRPRVAAVLVGTDGGDRLPAVLSALARQTYTALDLVVVDPAGDDGRAAVLADRTPWGALLTAPPGHGFTGGVAAALHHPAVAGADHVLLLHDDLALADDAVERLVEALERDPRLAVVGPKLRRWGAEGRLQSVGLTIDRYGCPVTPLEPGEYDQGQHDSRAETLYVPASGMLVRRSLLEAVGFDPRFPSHGNDLDLCWRAWIAGHRVAVVPAAVGYQAAADATPGRSARGQSCSQDRYLAERHSVAAVLKNAGPAHLVRALPVMALLAVARILAFLATRRFAAAAAVARAYLWNLRQLPATYRARRTVHADRSRSHRELAHLLAPGLPRLRGVVGTVGDWLAGGRAHGAAPSAGAEGSPRRALVGLAGLALLVTYLVGVFPLLGPGQLIGGEVAPWPGTPRAFLDALTAPWGQAPVASGVLASPAQAVLGIASLLGFGSAWAAQRLVVLGLLPLAWLVCLRAGRLFTARPGPRVAGATLYVAFPATWGPLASGRLGALVAAAILPGIAAAGVRAAGRRTPPGSGWRAVGLVALGAATILAFAPDLWSLLAGGWAALLAGALVAGRRPVARVAVAGVATVGLLAPWVFERGTAGWSLPAAGPVAGVEPGGLPLWRALAAAPPVAAGLDGVVGWLLAGLAAGLVAAAVAVGLRTRPVTVVVLLALAATSGIAGWAVAVAAPGHPRPTAFLLPGALALSSLGVIVAAELVGALRARGLGPARLVLVAGVTAVVAGAGASLVRVAEGPWDGIERIEEGPLPAFVTADAPLVGPYRVLLLTGDARRVRWELVGDRGPTMADFGTTASPSLLEAAQRAVVAASGGADPRAGAALGVLNVRYVVVPDPEGSVELLEALTRQPALEPLPSGDARVYRVESWLPRAAVLDAGRAAALRATGDPGPTRALEEDGLAAVGPGTYAGPAGDGRLLHLAESPSPRWRAEADGVAVEPVPVDDVQAFALPRRAGEVVVAARPPAARRWLTGVALAMLLAVASLAARPPGLTEAQVRRAAAADLPPALRPPAARAEEVAS